MLPCQFWWVVIKLTVIYKCTQFQHFSFSILHHSNTLQFWHFTISKYFISLCFLLPFHITKYVYFLIILFGVNCLNWFRNTCNKTKVFFQNLELHVWKKVGFYIKLLRRKCTVSNTLQVVNTHTMKERTYGCHRRIRTQRITSLEVLILFTGGKKSPKIWYH